MAQSQVSKRRNIATEAVGHAQALWNAVQELKLLQLERVQAGNFVDSDFDGTDLTHLTPFMIGTFLDNTVTAIAAVVDHPTQRDIILQVLK